MLKRSLRFRGKFVFFIFDLLSLCVIFALVSSLRFSNFEINIFFDFRFWFVALALLASLYVFGAYDLDLNQEPIKLTLKIAFAFLGSVFASILLYYFSHQDRAGLFGRGVLLGTLLAFFIFTLLLRLIVNSYYKVLAGGDEWLFVLSDQYVDKLKLDINKMGLSGQKTFLVEDLDTVKRSHLSSTGDKIDSIGKLETYLHKNWTAIVVAVGDSHSIPKSLSPQLMRARFSGNKILNLNNFYEDYFGKLPVYYLSDNWFVLTEGFALIHNPVGLRVKRVLDILFSSLFLFCLWPVMVLVMILIKLETKGSTIYRQVRTGLNGTPFKIYKFRSMYSNAEADGVQWAQRNDQRITKVGRFIRVCRIDELPQLFNILKGEMSFVGPRPERPEFNSRLESSIPFYNLRHLVNPGLTGWAQIIYPYGASLEDAKEKLQYDLYYIKHYSLLLDLIIFLKTISVVILARGR